MSKDLSKSKFFASARLFPVSDKERRLVSLQNTNWN